jgi:hypothetical protein
MSTNAQGSPHYPGNGGKGIRTPGAVNPAVFKTAAIDHSAIPPLITITYLAGLEKGHTPTLQNSYTFLLSFLSYLYHFILPSTSHSPLCPFLTFYYLRHFHIFP